MSVLGLVRWDGSSEDVCVCVSECVCECVCVCACVRVCALGVVGGKKGWSDRHSGVRISNEHTS